MKLLTAICLVLLTAGAQAQTSIKKIPTHPRLLLMKGEERALKADIRKDSLWTAVHDSILEQARSYIGMPLLERKKEGLRLLGVSREALKRIFRLSYAYRMTGDKRFMERGRDEMLAVARFSDWNPSHFLDVAEMTMAVAIGYDWLFKSLSAEERAELRKAIVEKGLRPSYVEKYNWFDTARNNWNQVCHGGMLYGAIAVMEDEPGLADSTINRALKNVRIAMQEYAPEGAYPEGVGYWEYGTTYNVMLLAAAEKLYKTDFGISEMPGFLKTGEFIQATTTPSMHTFCYSDNWSSRTWPMPAMFWFFGKTQDQSQLFTQAQMLRGYGMREIKYDRFAPAMLIFGAKANLSALQEPEQLFWKGEGPNPVCTMRSSWSESAHFVGFKMGMASVNHGHMDVGSFIYERDGIRWALDLGSENYNTLEQNMPDLWKGGQASGRWNVYRYNVRNHNTLCFDGERQIVSGKAELGKWSDRRGHMYATSDITPAYAGQVRKAERAVSLIDGEYVVVEDKISTLDRPTQLTWTLMTEAEGTKIDDNLVRLDARGQKLFLRVEGISSPEWTFSDAKPQTSYENQNKGIRCVRFNLNIPADTTINIRVFLTGDGRKRSYNTLL